MQKAYLVSTAEAMLTKHYALLVDLLKKNSQYDVEYKDLHLKFELTIQYAAENGDLDLVEELLKLFKDLNLPLHRIGRLIQCGMCSAAQSNYLELT